MANGNNSSSNVGNFLNYTNLTFDEIRSDISNRLDADPRFENFLESSISQTIIEIFAATTDLTNYYLERRAEEQYFDTARLKSSVIVLAKILGYIVTRPIPASSSLEIVIKGPLPSGLEAGDEVYFQKFNTKFQHQGFPYILTKTYKYIFTANDIADGTSNPAFRKTVNVAVTSESDLVLNEFGNVPLSATEPIAILQGEIIVQEVPGSANSQAGQIFQKYIIPDNRFSNLYGTEDLNYDTDTAVFDLVEGLTKVGVGPDEDTALDTEDNLFAIDRRSLLTNPEVLNQTQTLVVPKVCLLRTTPKEEVELLFGDDLISQIGARTTSDNIYIQYFATDGTTPNKVGVQTELVQTSNTLEVIGKPSLLITKNFEFRLNSNIVGGANLESMESIKVNAPSLFQSLDRLVSKQDYVIFLKSLTSPINVNNALAWGEQEEVEALNKAGIQTRALVKLFNIVFFSVVGDLYLLPPGGQYSPKDLTTADSSSYTTTILEGDYFLSTDENPSFGEQTYFNVYIKNSSTSCGGGVIEALNDQESLNAIENVRKVVADLQTRAQITTKNLYMSPIIQKYGIDGNVYLRNLTSINDLRTRVNNQIYTFLNDNADFNVPVFISNIVEIIENNREVINADISFEPLPVTSGTYTPVTDLSTDPDIVGTGLVPLAYEPTLVSLIEQAIFEYQTNRPNAFLGSLPIDSEYYDISDYKQIELETPPFAVGTWSTYESGEIRTAGITERTFYQELMDNMYNNKLNTPVADAYRDSDFFRSFTSRLNKTMKEAIRNSMRDSSGNITNYSLALEIVQMVSNITYRYKL